MAKQDKKRVDTPPASPTGGFVGKMSSVAYALAILILLAGIAFKYKLLEAPAFMIPRSEDLLPLRAPKMVELAELKDASYKDAMLWGSYRSGLYFGMRTRSPKSLLTGLMWFNPDSMDTLRNRKVRHQASQEDGLDTYGWQRHDGRTFGRQILIDEDYNISVSMVKQSGEESGTGGDWAVRLSASRVSGRDVPKGKRISLVMYLGDEGVAKPPGWSVMPEGEATNLREGATLATGTDAVVGPWSMHVVEPAGARKKPGRLDFLALPIDGNYDLILNAKELMMGIMWEQLKSNPTSDKFQLYLPNGATTGSNLALFQVTVRLPGTVDFVFLSHKKGVDPDLVDTSARVQSLTGEALTKILSDKEAVFNERFEKSFVLPGAYEGLDPVALEMSKAALSNLMGSIGYSYGSSKVRQPGGVVKDYWPAALYSAVPSRSFFPRGFLWDEGFHQLLVQRWDPQISRDIIAHWLDLLNAKGWIPREQILGKEAESRVPDEFVVQDPKHGNPPSLFLPIMNMAKQLQQGSGGQEGGDSESLAVVREFLQRAWPRLAAWCEWFNTTQAGPVPTSYRWHGRNASTHMELNPKTLTSGLDDYPRASHPTKDERHLDLRCWMALASEAMATIGEALRLPSSRTAPYRSTSDVLRDATLLQELHQNVSTGHYLDYGYHTEQCDLGKKSFPVDGKMQEITYRYNIKAPVNQLVPCYGYVSLFPILMKLLDPGSEELGRQLDLLVDPKLLWTPYGLRSVSPSCALYKKYNTAHDPPYWRGQIWININYLALSALDHYRSVADSPWAGKAAEAHAGLRQALLGNLAAQYSGRGYLFEQYDDTTGRGMSSHPFTGWTALVALVAAG